MAEFTVTTVLQLREGFSYESERFGKVVEKLRGEKGFVRQYWGEQVENAGFIVWVIDHKSFDDILRLAETDAYRSVWAALDEFAALVDVFNVGLSTKWSSPSTEVAAAMNSGITEIAFFTLSKPEAMEIADAMEAVEHEMVAICENVKTYGKCHGAAVGWLSDARSGKKMLHGVFGYDKLDDHMEWRKHPKIKDAGRAFESLTARGIVLMPEVGVKGVDGETGYFHVKFENS